MSTPPTSVGHPPILEGKVAIVTGAGSGLGRATAKLLAQAKASVIVVSLKTEEVASVVEEIRATGGEAVGLTADVADSSTPEAMMQSTLQAFGHLDILVNNAGFFERLDFLNAPFGSWQRMRQVLFDAPFRLSQVSARQMVKQGHGGYIVNVTSIMATVTDSGSTHYSSAKAGLAQLTRCLAVELAPHNILANAVAPGWMDTPMSIVDGKNALEEEEFLKWYVGRRKIPLARAALPHEVAEAIFFLVSPWNTYITGHVLTVDGGETCTL